MTAAFHIDQLSEEEYAAYQATGILPRWAQEKISAYSLELVRESAARSATKDPRTDPTLRNSVYLPPAEPAEEKVYHPDHDAHLYIHTEDCDMDESCTCTLGYPPATDEQIERSFDAYR